MRGKRSKQYRKLVAQYQMAFGFREPYQVLVDAEIIKDCHRQKMDLVSGLQRTLHAKEIKPTSNRPVITQCCMRHLYAAKNEPGMAAVITHAQNDFLRAFCGHHPDKYPEPLSTAACMGSLVDGKDTGRNAKHYVVATQDQAVRRLMRSIKGVPLIFERRGVIIMEPMADVSVQEKLREERLKFRAGLKKKEAQAGEKRKREDGDDGDEEEQDTHMSDAPASKKTPAETPQLSAEEQAAADKQRKVERKQKYKKYGKKEPNPLSVKKTKKAAAAGAAAKKTPSEATKSNKAAGGADKKRKRRKKSAGEAA
ncbi:hypothetical protein TD95_003915 [Thielaviopsis punctulata]|uniref:U three protein 23 n=1 Tax=Thielaviopsis punctulata TaxID=72032 RepID=A0A0F4ZBB1_9PEZI|nr:hypothetical protein TD95_003915 [Thielaviopsis punctulata]